MKINGIGMDFCGLGPINQMKQVEQNLGNISRYGVQSC